MQYIELPYYPLQTLRFDVPMDDLAENCFSPTIIEGAVEGSSIVLVAAEGMEDKVVVMLNTGDMAYLEDGIAIIDLKHPLRKGQTISAAFDAPNCKVSSCAITVKGLVANAEVCQPRENLPPDGTLTGAMRCDGVDLYQKVHDGNGGFKKGDVLIADCIWCGGQYPNCEEE